MDVPVFSVEAARSSAGKGDEAGQEASRKGVLRASRLSRGRRKGTGIP